LTGAKAQLRREPARPGDQRFTFADTGKLQRHFGWRPHVGLEAGLARQVEWQRALG
jgi:nucleoside-diphosphate-sugar epimerase